MYRFAANTKRGLEEASLQRTKNLQASRERNSTLQAWVEHDFQSHAESQRQAIVEKTDIDAALGFLFSGTPMAGYATYVQPDRTSPPEVNSQRCVTLTLRTGETYYVWIFEPNIGMGVYQIRYARKLES